MARLRVREVAEAQGKNMSQLQRESGVTMPSVRRYWYNTRDGKAEGQQIREIDLVVLESIAKALGVKTAELIGDIRTPVMASRLGNDQPLPALS